MNLNYENQIAKQTTVPSGPVYVVVDTLRLARDVADRAQYLVGRLCGHVPMGTLAGPPDAPSNGLLHDVAADAEMTRARLLVALEELTRLENTIGA